MDSARYGVNDWLASAFGPGTVDAPIEQKVNEDPGVGIGRLVNLKVPLPLSMIIPLVKSHLDLQHGV